MRIPFYTRIKKTLTESILVAASQQCVMIVHRHHCPCRRWTLTKSWCWHGRLCWEEWYQQFVELLGQQIRLAHLTQHYGHFNRFTGTLRSAYTTPDLYVAWSTHTRMANGKLLPVELFLRRRSLVSDTLAPCFTSRVELIVPRWCGVYHMYKTGPRISIHTTHAHYQYTKQQPGFAVAKRVEKKVTKLIAPGDDWLLFWRNGLTLHRMPWTLLPGAINLRPVGSSSLSSYCIDSIVVPPTCSHYLYTHLATGYDDLGTRNRLLRCCLATMNSLITHAACLSRWRMDRSERVTMIGYHRVNDRYLEQ